MSDIKRAGVIPYFECDNGDRMYSLGVDTLSKELSDWGGGVRKSDSNPYEAASRELKEETLGCIDLSPHQISLGTVLVDNSVLISFVAVDKGVLLSCVSNFRKRHSKIQRDKGESEMCGVKLLTTKDLQTCIQNDLVYDVVASVLRKHSDKIQLII